MQQNNLQFLHNTATHTCTYLCSHSISEQELSPLRAQLEELEARIVEQVKHKLLSIVADVHATYCHSRHKGSLLPPHKDKHASIHVGFDMGTVFCKSDFLLLL